MVGVGFPTFLHGRETLSPFATDITLENEEIMAAKFSLSLFGYSVTTEEAAPSPMAVVALTQKE